MTRITQTLIFKYTFFLAWNISKMEYGLCTENIFRMITFWTTPPPSITGLYAIILKSFPLMKTMRSKATVMENLFYFCSSVQTANCETMSI